VLSGVWGACGFVGRCVCVVLCNNGNPSQRRTIVSPNRSSSPLVMRSIHGTSILSPLHSLLLVFWIGLAGCTPLDSDPESASETFDGLIERTEQRLLDKIQTTRPARADGYVYAIDLAYIMRVGALLDNQRLFERAYTLVQDHLLQINVNDPRARYTVRWRYHPERPRDASGAKETGMVADALWTAFEQWGHPHHRSIAIKVLNAYLDHGYWETDRRFLVKNYYNYGTKTLSENTWLINQLPHTVRKIGCATRDSALLRTARGMSRFVRAGALQEGFSYEMYDPGIGTVIENASGYYSPNGILKLQSSLQIARTRLPFTTRPAQALLRFQNEKDHDLYTHYYRNPRTEDLRPLWEKPSAEYWISEQALFLTLATSVRGEIGDETVDELVGREVIPSLRKWKAYVSFLDLVTNDVPSAYYFEVPLLLEAAYYYQHPNASSLTGRDGCSSRNHGSGVPSIP